MSCNCFLNSPGHRDYLAYRTEVIKEWLVLPRIHTLTGSSVLLGLESGYFKVVRWGTEAKRCASCEPYPQGSHTNHHVLCRMHARASRALCGTYALSSARFARA